MKYKTIAFNPISAPISTDHHQHSLPTIPISYVWNREKNIQNKPTHPHTSQHSPTITLISAWISAQMKYIHDLHMCQAYTQHIHTRQRITIQIHAQKSLRYAYISVTRIYFSYTTVNRPQYFSLYIFSFDFTS